MIALIINLDPKKLLIKFLLVLRNFNLGPHILELCLSMVKAKVSRGIVVLMGIAIVELEGGEFL